MQVKALLTLKAPITTAAGDNFFFQRKQVLTFHVNSHASHEMSRLIFSEKKKKKNLECCLLQILLGTLRVKSCFDNSQKFKFGFALCLKNKFSKLSAWNQHKCNF